MDLNLLRVFDAIMTERHVTRAAERLHMTQPAVSNALRRLRDQLDDELFVRASSGVQPTARAEAIWPAIHESLLRIQDTVSPRHFEPRTHAGTFRLSLTDYAAALLLPCLVPRLEAEAPDVDLRLVPNVHVHSAALIESGEIDMALGVFRNPGALLHLQTVLRERYVCAMRKDHPLAREPLTVTRFAAATHLLVTPSGTSSGIVDHALAERGLTRRIGLTVNQFLLAPRILLTSRLIAVLPERTVRLSNLDDRIHVAPVPFELAPLQLSLLWHARTALDPAQVWLRAHIAAICQEV